MAYRHAKSPESVDETDFNTFEIYGCHLSKFYPIFEAMRFRNVLLLLLFLDAPLGMFASHIHGAAIWYTHVSTSSTQATYLINLRLLTYSLNYLPGVNESITVKSDDGSIDQLITLNQVGTTSNYSGPCGMGTVSDFSAYFSFTPGKNVKFIYEYCCRNALTSVVLPASQSMHVEAKVNTGLVNPRGFDNGVELSQFGMRYVRVGQANVLPLLWAEADGDSVALKLVPAMRKVNGIPVSVPYAAGYRAGQPIPNAAGWDSLRIHAANDALSVVPSAVGTTALVLRYLNYGWNATTNARYLAGYSTSDGVVEMQANLGTPIPWSVVPGTTPNQITLQTASPVYEETYVGDEFSISTTSGQNLGGVLAAQWTNTSGGTTITLFTDPSIIAGNYLLNLDTAFDQTTLIGSCANWVPSGSVPVVLPFKFGQIYPVTGGGGSGLYAFSDTTQSQSITWLAVGANLSHLGVTQSSPFTTQSWAPVDVNMTQTQGVLYAIRNGEGGATDTVSFALMSGLESIETSADELFVTPNPSNSRFALSSPVVGSYSLWSVYGQVLEAGPAAQEIDLSAYQSGLYLLEIRPDDGSPQLLKLYLRR